MLFSTSSLIVLSLGLLAIFLPHMRVLPAQKEISSRMHRLVCVSMFVVGCFVRLFALGTLPNGISAEEALVGVQAKALWETGGFLFEGGWTTQLAQWTGESAGPLLAALTAPFVGLFGMTPWMTRLPLALLSCAAMPAMYGVGNLLGGKRAARWCLVIYAICPYFVLTARLTAAANAAVFLLPIALYMMLAGLKKPGYLYAGTLLMGLMSYTQNMYFFIAPTAVLLCGVFAVLSGMKIRHALCAVALGMLVCVPGIMTLWVNLGGREGFVWLGMVRIPALESFDKAENAMTVIANMDNVYMLRDKFWAVITGSVFQVLVHLNISAEMFAPKGMSALYILSIPLMILGALSLVRGLLHGVRYEKNRVRACVMMCILGCATVFWLFLFGSDGYLDQFTGYTCVYDYSAMLLFNVLLMAAGLCHMERRSLKGTGALSLLFAASFVMLGMHLFGSGYSDNTNTYFTGFGDLARKANTIAQDKDTKVNVTGTVYPHIAPSDAAEMMYLYAVDADMQEMLVNYRESYDMIYAPGVENPDPQQVYLVTQSDIAMWDLDAFQYEEMGEYVLLTPIGE